MSEIPVMQIRRSKNGDWWVAAKWPSGEVEDIKGFATNRKPMNGSPKSCRPGSTRKLRSPTDHRGVAPGFSGRRSMRRNGAPRGAGGRNRPPEATGTLPETAAGSQPDGGSGMEIIK